MSDLFWLTEAQMAKLSLFFPKPHGKPRVDGRRIRSGIIFINRNGLRWRDAPEACGPHKTLYSKRRNSMEIMFGRLKDWRRVATRYDRCPKVFLSALALAAVVICWR
uniref:transposase n=1 Tax=Tritonibacter mobilis TaxID=379347 RepID=UPI0009BDF159|nr:transposase [Tritonibacter mobilis]